VPVDGATLVLGDRRVDVTVSRFWNSLSFWQKLRLGWELLVTDVDEEMMQVCAARDACEALTTLFADVLLPRIFSRCWRI